MMFMSLVSVFIIPRGPSVFALPLVFSLCFLISSPMNVGDQVPLESNRWREAGCSVTSVRACHLYPHHVSAFILNMCGKKTCSLRSITVFFFYLSSSLAFHSLFCLFSTSFTCNLRFCITPLLLDAFSPPLWDSLSNLCLGWGSSVSLQQLHWSQNKWYQIKAEKNGSCFLRFA